MRIWLLQSGEQLPSDTPGSGTRLMRTGTVACMLDAAGHEVTWWAGTFNHTTKRQRASTYTETKLFYRSRVCLLPGRAYARNVSLARLLNYRQVAGEFAWHAKRQPLPDIILAAYPSIDLAAAAVRFARQHHVPVVVDIRDLWPDIFMEALPPILRPFSGIFLNYYGGLKRQTLQNADVIWGTSDKFIEWGLSAAGRPRRPQDQAFALAYQGGHGDAVTLAAARARWASTLKPGANAKLFCYIGSFGERVLDLETVIEAARQASQHGLDYRFVLCGTGPSLQRHQDLAIGLPNVIFPGLIDASAVRALMEISTAGLVPYKPLWDFQMTVPNKAIEYLSASLPVLASQGGELTQLIDEHACGIAYQAGDVASLLDALALSTTAGFRHAAQAAARTLFEQRFDASVVYQQYIDALLKLTKTENALPA